MSRRRRVAKVRRLGVSAVVQAMLCDDPLPERTRHNAEELFVHTFHRRTGELEGPTIEDYWRDHSATVLEQWTELYPGSRPSCWWEFDAPRWSRQPNLAEPRLRLGGGGVPDHELPFAATWRLSQADFHYGIPLRWQHQRSPADEPPIFESDAAHLDRHGLLMPAESRLLNPIDFEPEPMEASWLR